MIRIALCDDEKKILDDVSGYIQTYAEKKNEEIEVYKIKSSFGYLVVESDGYELLLSEDEILNAYPDFGY